MRNHLLLASTATLAACGGGTAPQTVGSVAPPVGTSGTASTATPTPTASFVNPSEAKTYAGIGGVQHYQYTTRSDGNSQSSQLYAGDASSARSSGISVTYDPRDAIFDITINQPKGNVSTSALRFQDPMHRTDFGGVKQPQASVPQLPNSANVQYLQAGTASGMVRGTGEAGYPAQSNYAVGAGGYTSSVSTFFYQKPGTTTQYVTYAGFVRNTLSTSEQVTTDASATPYLLNSYSLDRASFVYGERTANSAVPTSGAGAYTGDLLATMVFNPNGDTDPRAATYFQWITGSQTTMVNFGTLAVTTTMTGTVSAPALDAYTNGVFDLPGGSKFGAIANSKIDLVGTGGFVGTVASANFTRPDLSKFDVIIAGSSVDGAFFGPKGEEIGAGFRIVGGTPDERIDILGSFTGKK